MNRHQQRDAFLKQEGDEWFSRNPSNSATSGIDERLASLLAPEARVLEVGCADGRRLAAIGSLNDGPLTLSGVDPSEKAILFGRRQWPHLDLHIGTADRLPEWEEPFDLVLLGFCLYLCDRALLPRIVAEVDRVLRDGGVLAIYDFRPSYPRCRPYKHRSGIYSFKMDYSSLFAAFPQYRDIEHIRRGEVSIHQDPDDDDPVVLSVLRKDLTGGYAFEPDPDVPDFRRLEQSHSDSPQ